MLKILASFRLLKVHFNCRDAFAITLALIFRRARVKLPSRKVEVFIRPNTKDRATFKEVFVAGIYNTPLPIVPQTIVDAGANVGLASVFFKMKYPGAEIVAIEIESENVAMIKKNTAAFRDITVLEKALYNKKSFFQIEDPYHATNSFQVREVSNDDNHDIESVTLDDILATKQWATIDILKLDIEGAEKELFEEHYQNWLPRTKVIMVETHDRMKPKCSYAVMKAINEYNFILFTTTEGTLVYFNVSLMTVASHT